jgi:hypothetical protein
MLMALTRFVIALNVLRFGMQSTGRGRDPAEGARSPSDRGGGSAAGDRRHHGSILRLYLALADAHDNTPATVDRASVRLQG